MKISRRGFLGSAVATPVVAGTLVAGAASGAAPTRRGAARDIIVAAGNGLPYLDRAYALLTSGGDTLDAAIAVVTGPEDDPEDDSVGLGGLPNEEGVVELDACCMHGPTRRAGSVGAVRNIRNVSKVAKAVIEHTGHVMLVGEGAERFAVAMGFPRENLLTERSRKIWLLWKETHSTNDWWGPGPASPGWRPPAAAREARNLSPAARVDSLYARAMELGIEPGHGLGAVRRVLFPPTGTIHCSALNARGEMSGITTTSGLAFKLPGRCGDSPVIGAGCFTDQDVGSAGATGSGEENIRVAGAHTIVENLRRGMEPLEAGLDALKRIVRNYNGDMTRLKYIDMIYYVLRNDGAYAGVSLWEGYGPTEPHHIAVHDGTKARAERTVALFKGWSDEFPPTPSLPPERATK